MMVTVAAQAYGGPLDGVSFVAGVAEVASVSKMWDAEGGFWTFVYLLRRDASGGPLLNAEGERVFAYDPDALVVA